MSLFLKHNLLFLRDPQGGVEDIAAMKSGGFGIVACNVQKEIPASEWQTVRTRAAQVGMNVVPWCYIWNLGDLDRLIAIADTWGAPPLVNVEKELDTGVFTSQQIADKLGPRDAAFSTEAWLYANVDWKPLSKWPVMLQIFPLESQAAKDPIGCRKHAYASGFNCVTFTFGTYDVSGVQPQPSDYDLRSPYQLYTADDLTYCYPHYDWWKATGVYDPCVAPPPPSPTLPPLTEEQCPYTGPYYPISKKWKPDRGKTVKALKIAMERLKMGKFPDPKSNVYGAQLRDAMYKWQASVGIDPPTGNYGKKSWYELRKATVGNEYALNKEARDLIIADSLD